ncbi:MAG TPA: sulfurtransferase [Ilumatobacteraceae bacterium]|nr:sulfurtransferase [Ilumatobacteraceae bacterium]
MPIVDISWLQRRLVDDPAAVVCDVRSTMGGADPRADHVAGHLPGAVLVVLDEVLATPPGGILGRHPLPTPDAFARSLGALGIADDATVVAYDDRGGAFASRLVWMLRIIGQDARLLDGGLAAWPGDVAHDVTHRSPVQRAAIEWPAEAIADADAVAAHIHSGGTVIDSREPARYAGEVEPIDPVAGHIPGAVNVPFAGNLDHHGRFLPAAAIARRFAAAAGDDAAIVYCGSGVTACHNAVAFEYAGLPRPRVYVGSWSGWSADPERPVATAT